MLSEEYIDMNNAGKIAKESAISFSGMGLGQIFRYLFTTLLARWAGVELLGIYSIANAVTRIFETVGKLGLDQGVLRAVSRAKNSADKQSVIFSALNMGLITRIINSSEIEQFTYNLAKNICELAPLSHIQHKEILKRVLKDPDLENLTDKENNLPFEIFDSSDFNLGRKAFISKKGPKFRGD